MRTSPNAYRSSDSPEESSPWSSLENLPSPDDDRKALKTPEASTPPERDTLRQEDKLIALLTRDDSSKILRTHSVSVSDSERLAVYDRIVDGSLASNTESRILRQIAPPSKTNKNGSRDVLEKLSSKQEKRILARFVGAGFDNYDSNTPADVDTFLERYPTPVEFATQEARFLEGIRTNNPDAKYRQYLSAMSEFKHKIYGKRQEYHEAFESLVAKANALRPVSEVERRNFLETCHVEGDAFLLEGKSYHLTPETLERYDLAPAYAYTLGDVRIGLSKPYWIDGGRLAVNAYVRTQTGGVICSYYRSNSQGAWRCLPDYVSTGDPSNPVEWYGKGYSEESLTLPAASQAALEQLLAEPRVRLNRANASFAFAGTANRYASKLDYARARSARQLRGRPENLFSASSPS